MRSAKSKAFDLKAAKNTETRKKQAFHFVVHAGGNNMDRCIAKADLAFKGKTVELMDAEVIDSLTYTLQTVLVVVKTEEVSKFFEDTWPAISEEAFTIIYQRP
ncbi:hypothetical protein TWF569_004694 [Orbilia oligospora]|nr:hypothetical protein TWF569_004694 [Orbilia oligospora]